MPCTQACLDSAGALCAARSDAVDCLATCLDVTFLTGCLEAMLGINGARPTATTASECKCAVHCRRDGCGDAAMAEAAREAAGEAEDDQMRTVALAFTLLLWLVLMGTLYASTRESTRDARGWASTEAAEEGEGAACSHSPEAPGWRWSRPRPSSPPSQGARRG